MNPIAPCGLHCALCYAFQRRKKPCPGCNAPDVGKLPHCTKCTIRNCPDLRLSGDAWEHGCGKFPCRRLRQLDARYRIRYGVSLLQNLRDIAACGLAPFLEREAREWACPACSARLCVHHGSCPSCGAANPHFPDRVAPGGKNKSDAPVS